MQHFLVNFPVLGLAESYWAEPWRC